MKAVYWILNFCYCGDLLKIRYHASNNSYLISLNFYAANKNRSEKEFTVTVIHTHIKIFRHLISRTFTETDSCFNIYITPGFFSFYKELMYYCMVIYVFIYCASLVLQIINFISVSSYKRFSLLFSSHKLFSSTFYEVYFTIDAAWIFEEIKILVP